MSNNNVVNGGLRLKDAVNGAGAGVEIVLIPSSDSNNMGIGDPVNEVAGDSASIGSGPKVNKVVQGTATGAVYGVVESYMPHMSDGTATMNLSQVYRSASTNMYALIRVGNTQDVYEMTDDAATPGLTSGHLNYNYKFIAQGCDTSTGLSKFYIDSANGATTATYPIQVIAPSDDNYNNNIAYGYARWRVRLNNVIRSGGTGTAGV